MSTPDATPSSVLRWGLVGYGDLAGKRVAAALQQAEGSTLSGIWGRSYGKSQSFAERHQISHAHATLESLLQSDIDAVYVCTPPDSHAEYTLPTIAAGKHVLVEKPMAASVAECESMVAAARDKGVTLGVAYYRRGYPKMQKVKQLIEEGVLGTPTWVNIAAHSWFNPIEGDPQYWRVQKARSGGGGAVADIGVHRLDLLQYWLGSCRAVCRHLQHLVQPYEVEDGASVILELSNGAPVHAYFAWNSRTWIDRFELVGSEGKIIAEPLDGAPLIVIRGREREELAIDPPANAHLPCIEDFVRAVQERRTPLCDGVAGLETNRLLEAIVA
ncbi:MAG TPA: Gfo/Idh/MocA family oxidoreductase [Abditibacteriaceae bacterium]|nr:Gfo/Idh/MocA family oxidoreductase [Abditibacteriaceae bacterium]